MHSLGGVTVTTERSQEFDQGHILSERYADLHLMAGPHGLKQSLRPGLRRRVLMTGFPLDVSPMRRLADRGSAVKAELSPDLPLVLLVDEGGLRFGRDHVFAFYEAMLKDLEASDSYRMVVKSKKLVILDQAYARNAERINRLVEEGKLFFLEFGCSASVAASLADICISLPSTAMFDPMVLEKPTAVYNPGHSLHSVFYEQGLADSLVFDDMDTLLNAFHGYLRGECPGFGDGSSFVKEINPHRDEEAVARTAHVIELLRRKLSRGKAREEALDEVLKDFQARWGQENAGEWDRFIQGEGRVRSRFIEAETSRQRGGQ